MQIRYFLPVAILLFLFACHTTKERAVVKGTPFEQAVQPASDWDSFWKSFTTAIAQNDREKVAGMTKLPLHTNISQEALSKEKFVEQYANFFDKTAVAKFQIANGRDFRIMPSNEQTGGYMNTPVGMELKIMNVNYIYDAGTDGQTESSKTFVFGEMEGHYKLMAVMIAG